MSVAMTGGLGARADEDSPRAPTAAEHRAKYNYTRVQPLLDVPMIDAAITRGPDGMYYLTGTTGKERPEDGGQRSEVTDFSSNDGIRLWRSKDLKTWDDLGVVAPRSLVKAKAEDLGLVRSARHDDEMQGLLAPEIHFIKGGVYLTYSLKPCGTGLLKSRTGKPEGPYEDLGLITKDGADASLFQDEDGAAYWVFGGGWLAKMKPDLTGLAEAPRLVQPAPAAKPNSPGSGILQVGQAGAFLFKKGGVYHLLAAGIQSRVGVPCYDTWVSTAKSLDGPWTQRKVAVAHGGQATMFEGPDGQWYSTFSGVDSRAALRERAAIVPVNWVTSVKYFYPKDESWPWKDDKVVTEAWGWEHSRPLTELSYRDPFGVNGKDGYFYISGLHSPGSHGHNINLIRGKDLTGSEPWEAFHLPGFETVNVLPWYAPTEKGFKVGACKPFAAGGTFWVSLAVSGGRRVLRSTSGTMNAPWVIAVNDAGEDGNRIGPWCAHPFQDNRGDLYGYLSGMLWPMNKEFTALEKGRKPPTEAGYEPVYDARLEGYRWETTDGSSLLRGDAPVGHPFRIGGKYLMMGGCGWHGVYRAFGTYDSCVFWAHEIGGPWHPNRSVLPHSGNSGIFQDNDGGWWNVVFANDSFLPDGGLRCLPLEIQWNGNGYDISPKHKPETPYVRIESAIVPDAGMPPPAYTSIALPDDIVLRAPAVTAVEEGGAAVFYLTGTAPAPASDKSNRSHEVPDFHNNDGVYLWKSSDLTTWTPLGRVFDLGVVSRLGKGAKANSWNSPMLVYFSPPDSLEPRYDRGLITPKLYRIKGDWWILCSAGRQQVCLLKSQSGKPEGPYDLQGPGAIHGSTAGILDSGFVDSRTDAYMFAYDPSFFTDEDGTVYLVFGPGWMAKMEDDIGKGLAEVPRRIDVADGLYAGKGACQILKKDGRYHLFAANEWGDTIERTADTLHGRYGQARLVLPQSGPAWMFERTRGKWTAVFE
jgi:beta-xylosidase